MICRKFLKMTIIFFIAVSLLSGVTGCGKSGGSPYSTPTSTEISILLKDELLKNEPGEEAFTTMQAVPNMIYINPYVRNAKIYEEFSLDVSVNNISDLFAVPFYLKYDPMLLQFVSAKEGPFLGQDGNSTAFLFFNDANRGRVIVGLARSGQVKGVSGSGVIMSINFKAIGTGNAHIVFDNVSAKKTTSENLVPQLFPVTFMNAQINVK